MTLDDLIKAAADTNKLPDSTAVGQAADAIGTSVNDLCGLFAVTVARRYLKGEYSYEFADGAMVVLAFVKGLEDLPGDRWPVDATSRGAKGDESATRTRCSSAPAATIL
jgi:hypothetical protein